MVLKNVRKSDRLWISTVFAIVVMKKTGWHLMIQIFVQYVRIDFLRMLQQKDVPYAG